MTRNSYLADLRRRERELQQDVRGRTFVLRLQQAYPTGRTLASIAEEEGWTPGQARGAVEAGRRWKDENITYAPESRTFYYVP